jgi:hypothetical protein
MKYLLKNIAQHSPMRTILLVLVGLSLWIIYLREGEIAEKLLGLTLTVVNSVLMTHCIYRIGWINMPSSFAGTTAWIMLTALSLWCTCWQVHIVALIYMITIMIFSKINIQQEATEQAYILVLIWLIFSPQLSVIITSILYIIGYLLTRTHFTWRVLVAILLAIATYVMYAAIIRYLGWLEPLWLENTPKLPWLCWIGAGSVYILLWIIIFFPIKKPSVVSGIIYIIGVTSAIVAGVTRLLV